MKRIIKSMSGLFIILFAWLSLCFWAPRWVGGEDPDAKFPFNPVSDVKCGNGETDLWNCVSVKGEKQTVISKLLDVFNIDIDKDSDHKFLNYVKAILNVALGLLSMVALIMTIYTFYLMFFTENEAWAKKAKWNLVGIFIALAIIWLAWLIVSFIFRWYQEQWQKRNEEIEKWNITMVNYEMDNNLDNQIYLTV